MVMQYPRAQIFTQHHTYNNDIFVVILAAKPPK